tara:strand:+ start:6720 stop:6947 length:228 start_codon:yes stop_codon:yes gene_type:complete
MSKRIEEPEFLFIKEVHLPLIAMPMRFEIYRNKDNQFLVVTSDETNKSITFYPNFDLLESVYSDDFSVEEINSWR